MKKVEGPLVVSPPLNVKQVEPTLSVSLIRGGSEALIHVSSPLRMLIETMVFSSSDLITGTQI